MSLPSPAQSGNSFPSGKGFSSVLQKLHFCSHHVQIGLGKRRNPPVLLYSYLKLHLFNKILGCHLGTSLQHLSDPKSSRKEMGKGFHLWFFVLQMYFWIAERILVFCCCSWLGLLFLAPSAARPGAGCLFHAVVTPGKSYGSARKKLPQQHQLLEENKAGRQRGWEC